MSPFSDPLRRVTSNAEILLWQSGVRLAVAALLLAMAIVFRAIGFSDAGALGRLWLGAPAHMVAAAGLAALYGGAMVALRAHLRRRRRAGTRLLVAVTALDCVTLVGSTALVAPPDGYARVLLLSFFALQLAQLHFGRWLAGLHIALMVALYLLLAGAASAAGTGASWLRELWTLTAYAMAATGFLLLQGSVSARLARLVRMFGRAEEGDFGEGYDVGADRHPDHVTAVGRAYNRMRAHLATIVLTDPLSGCLDRRGFDAQMEREAARAARAGDELSLLALDVDYFKLVNDGFGHLAGDAAIREIGQLLRDTARTGDVLARIGGEEFMVLAPATNAAGAYQLAQRIATAFRERRFAAVDGRLPITASIGVVTEPRVTEGIAEALRARADEALYAAKRSGRNRVVVWTQGLQPFATPVVVRGEAVMRDA